MWENAAAAAAVSASDVVTMQIRPGFQARFSDRMGSKRGNAAQADDDDEETGSIAQEEGRRRRSLTEEESYAW